ncbi:precorrin-6y C5,15-methyltransferase (decarboxylating) subunit CbiE [Puniceicoccus vermicola]|uniref:Precorrin-6y C5,15-methyltransferase (Decarboxylating) subunit CbiE n=1 Tax=Puniceicoccus vermicola TaxID=388746 RepID=A0A7X1AZM7_9BACT|nr:precorrin-6y C5,15-methyltransferase (decarboxylating) subunit CbiE [Puniceicoccus vermicola]MBC2602877.1 precorrin-6y C5,15-methyltransferase (decarboxylating) subunit CbiE [Puniceicoccus vermicola]
MAHPIHIISCGTCREDLTQASAEAVRHCDILYGGKRLLDWFDEPGFRKIPLTASLDAEIQDLRDLSEDHPIAVLASGDSLFFGIASRLRASVPLDQLVIHPGISAMQAASSRLALDWHQARFFSIHGRNIPLPWRPILQSPLAVIYGDNQRSPSWIAQELLRRYPESANRQAHIAENVGSPAERILSLPLGKIPEQETRGLSMLILEGKNSRQFAPLSLGLPDETYEHENNLITHPEIRAIALAKLQLRPGVLWDLGAGSGSVGLEAAGLVGQLSVHSVEKDPQRTAMIETNRTTQGLSDFTVWNEKISVALPQLPDPSSVFIGGGGREIRHLVETAFERLQPGGRIVATAILADSVAQLSSTLPDSRLEWLEVSVRRAKPLAHSSIMQLDNPINLFVFEKPIAS